MGREIINARERVGEQAKWTFFFVLNKVRVWRPSWQHTFTLSPDPPQPPKRTSWFPLTNFRSLLPNDGMRVFRRVRPQDTYSVSKSIKLWSTAACAGTSPEATEKEQQSTLKIKNATKIYNHNINTTYVENSVSQISETGSLEKIPSSLYSSFYSYMYR